jgi:hypothetical protein
MSEQLDRLSLGKVRDVGQEVRHVDGEVVVDVVEADHGDKLIWLARVIGSDFIAAETTVGGGPEKDALALFDLEYSGVRVLDDLGHMDVKVVLHVEHRARRLGNIQEAGAVRNGRAGSKVGCARRLVVKENCPRLGDATHTYAHPISKMFTLFSRSSGSSARLRKYLPPRACWMLNHDRCIRDSG